MIRTSIHAHDHAKLHATPINQTITMLRALIYGLTILHLGPGFAFAVLAFGCDSIDPALGDFCAGNQLKTFAWLTFAAWAVMIAGYIVWQAVAGKQQSKS